MNDPRPTPPHASDEVFAWLDLHPDADGQTLEVFRERTDLSEPVREHIASMERHRVELAAWKLRQPIDVGDEDLRLPYRWRMYGGPWIDRLPHYVEADIPSEDEPNVLYRVVESPISCAGEALARLGPEGFREWAATFYEKFQAERDAHNAFVLHLRTGRQA